MKTVSSSRMYLKRKEKRTKKVLARWPRGLHGVKLKLVNIVFQQHQMKRIISFSSSFEHVIIGSIGMWLSSPSLREPKSADPEKTFLTKAERPTEHETIFGLRFAMSSQEGL